MAKGINKYRVFDVNRGGFIVEAENAINALKIGLLQHRKS